MTPATDTKLRRFTGYRIKRAFNAIRADVNAVLADHGLRLLGFSALTILQENGTLRPGQLADALSIERPNMVTLADRLVADGWVDRTRDTKDRRAVTLRLSKDGTTRLARVRADVAAHDAAMMAGLTSQERTLLNTALAKIEANGAARKGPRDAA